MFEDDVTDAVVALRRQHDLVQLVTYLHVHVIDGRDVAEDELDVGDVKQRPARLVPVFDLFFEALTTSSVLPSLP